MKKIYFLVGISGPIYYMKMPDDWNESRLDIGYNDSYEMRSLYTTLFSENIEDMKMIIIEHKKALMVKKYKEMLDVMSIKTNFKEEDALYHDGFDAPI